MPWLSRSNATACCIEAVGTIGGYPFCGHLPLPRSLQPIRASSSSANPPNCQIATTKELMPIIRKYVRRWRQNPYIQSASGQSPPVGVGRTSEMGASENRNKERFSQTAALIRVPTILIARQSIEQSVAHIATRRYDAANRRDSFAIARPGPRKPAGMSKISEATPTQNVNVSTGINRRFAPSCA